MRKKVGRARKMAGEVHKKVGQVHKTVARVHCMMVRLWLGWVWVLCTPERRLREVLGHRFVLKGEKKQNYFKIIGFLNISIGFSFVGNYLTKGNLEF